MHAIDLSLHKSVELQQLLDAFIHALKVHNFQAASHVGRLIERHQLEMTEI